MHREFATGFRRIRPRRSYKNFGLFCLAHGSDIGNRYPCLACRGQGRIDDPADPPCPVEGTNTSDALDAAGECRREREGQRKEDCSPAYRETVEAYRRKSKAESTIRRAHRARSKDTATSDASNAPPASEAAKARKKPAARRTGKRSKHSAKSRNTTGSSASAKPRSHGSRKTKSLPSAS